MSDLYVEALTDDMSADAVTFASLQLPLAQRIFLALPPDARGRASCVCRAWRDVLAETALWTSLDMSGVRAVTGAEWQRFAVVLHGAAGRARGQLFLLDLSQHDVASEVLLPVLTANAGSLRELHLRHVCVDFDTKSVHPIVQAFVHAAPLLQVLTIKNVDCTWKDAQRLLRAEPPFAPLQVSGRLEVSCFGADGTTGGMERVGLFIAALADASLHPALSGLRVRKADTAQPAVMGALVDAMLARRLHELTFDLCTPPAAAPLARLLAEGSLAVLDFGDWHWSARMPLFDAAGAALVAYALRVNTTLTKLKLDRAYLCRDINGAGTFLGALVGHSSLRELRIFEENTNAEDCNAFGAALGALVAADTPALQVLECFRCSLGDAGLAPIFMALPLNHHLRELYVDENRMSKAFAHERLLPAVRANTTLRELKCANRGSETPAAEFAEKVVRRRGQQG
jgi:hypothetical protein